MGQFVYKYFAISGAIIEKYLWTNVLTGQSYKKHTGVHASKIISSLTFAQLGSSGVSKEVENFKELEFLGLGCCF